jgi:hypothetical protein
MAICPVLWRNCHKKFERPAPISGAWQRFAQSQRFAPSELKSMASIANYEKKLAQARPDLAHITAAITIFEASVESDKLLDQQPLVRSMSICASSSAAHKS